jgi:hypothetical protein
MAEQRRPRSLEAKSAGDDGAKRRSTAMNHGHAAADAGTQVPSECAIEASCQDQAGV